MDFLRLFSSPSSDLASNEHLQQQSSPQQLLFCAYRNLGLLCHSDGEPNKLHLVIIAPTPTTSKTTAVPTSDKTCVLFKRITSIALSPKLPENAQFTRLLVNASGSRAALVGCRMIFVVELDTDFWHCPTFGGPDNVDHLRSEYYAKCDLLHVGLFVRKFPPSVLCVRWFDPKADVLEFFGSSNNKIPTLSCLNSLIAVLFSDNVIRLYNVSTAVDCPLVQLDFNALLPDRTPDESEASGDEFGRATSTLGFITQLVSFDFGPSHGNDKISFGSLLALDSNGQLYSAVFPFDGIGGYPSPRGPLHLFGLPSASQQRLLCSALDLLHVRHPFGTKHFSMWAMASEDGLLTHFLGFSSFDAVPFAGDNANILPSTSFDLFAVECVEIDSSNSHHSHKKSSTLKTINRLQKIEFSDHLTYLVISQRDVFIVELTALADHFWHQCSLESNCGPKTIGEASSSVHHLLMFTHGGEAPHVGSLACVQTSVSNVTAGNNQQPEQQFLVAAECSFGPKMGRKSVFLATLMSCILPSSFSHCAVAPPSSLLPGSHQMPVQNNQKSVAAAAAFNKTSLLADDVRSLLSQQQAVSAAQLHLPQSLPAVVHFNRNAATGGDEVEEELEQLNQRASQLCFVQQSIDQVLLQGQLPARSVAIDYALKRANELLCSLRAVEHFRQNATQRLTNIFRQLNELKTKVRQRQQCLRVAEQRILRIAQAMNFLMFSTSDAEKRAVETVKQIQHKLRECVEETAKIADRVRAHRHALCSVPSCSPSFTSFSPSSSFAPSPLPNHPQSQLCQRPLPFISAPCALHSSHGPAASTNAIPAQLFMLSKNGRECSKLREMVTSLAAQLDGTTKTYKNL